MFAVLFILLIIYFLGYIPAIIVLLSLWFIDSDFSLYIRALITPKPSFENKVVWITGASSGIGEELAYQMASAGATLILSARRESELERVRKACKNSSKHIIVPLDLDNFASHKGIADGIFKRVKKVDILINNAGVSQRSLSEETIFSVYETLIRTNTLGPISLTKAVLPYFLEQIKKNERPQIIVVSSLAGKVGAPISSGYSASKYALHGFFNSVRIEIPQIDISIVCPGPVKSAIGEGSLTETGITAKEAKIPPVYNLATRMKTERCAFLICVTAIYRLKEVWMSPNPELLYTYLGQYSPILFGFLSTTIGHQRVVQWKAKRKQQ